MKLRVGICDDEKSVIEILQQCMEQYQMHQDVELEVESFTNGNELLAMNRVNPYHVVLLDVEMPEIDGLEVARRLREDNTYSRTGFLSFSVFIYIISRIRINCFSPPVPTITFVTCECSYRCIIS